MATKKYKLTLEQKDKCLQALRDHGVNVPPGDKAHVVENGFDVYISYDRVKEELTIDLRKTPMFKPAFAVWIVVDRYYEKVKRGDYTK